MSLEICDIATSIPQLHLYSKVQYGNPEIAGALLLQIQLGENIRRSNDRDLPGSMDLRPSSHHPLESLAMRATL